VTSLQIKSAAVLLAGSMSDLCEQSDSRPNILHTSGQFLRVKAATALAHLSHCNSVSVCLSVRPSHRWISQKHCKL